MKYKSSKRTKRKKPIAEPMNRKHSLKNSQGDPDLDHDPQEMKRRKQSVKGKGRGQKKRGITASNRIRKRLKSRKIIKKILKRKNKN